MPEIIVREPETVEEKIAVSKVVILANELQVTNDIQLHDAADMGRAIKKRMTLVKEKFKEPTQAAHDAHKKIVALRDEIIDPLKEAETTVKSKMSHYQLEQERIRIEAEERARKERERIEAEAHRKHEAELEKARKEAEERQLQEAEDAEKSGDTEKAKVIIESEPEADFVPPPAPIDAPPVMPEQKKPKGTSLLKTVKPRIIHEDSVPREFCSPDMRKLEAYGKAMGKTAKVDGVVFYEDTQIRIRK